MTAKVATVILKVLYYNSFVQMYVNTNVALVVLLEYFCIAHVNK